MGVELKSVRSMKVTSIDLLPEPLKKVRGHSLKLLASMLASMFDNTDDALFELADKAASNVDQTMYFDSMREVRIKREAMAARFISATQEHFKLFYGGPAAQQIEPVKAEFDGTNLSLVSDDDLEKNVAIRGMISKVSNLFGQPLGQLTERMDSLVSSVTVSETNNPLGPAKLSEAFQQASEELELDIRAKLVVFKLFEKFVLSELQELYAWSNQSLVEAGVLPKIKPAKQPKDYASSGPVGTSQAAGSPPSQTGDTSGLMLGAEHQQNEVFSLLRGLLANSAPQQSQSYRGQLPVADSGPVLSHAELVDMLSVMQQQNRPVDNLQPERVDVRKALSQLADNTSNDKALAVGRVDNDSINLVSMLFEFILDDHNLPVTMKALLARLQIPMLKVALLDKSFFSRGAHPARKLLNELARAAMSWNEPADIGRDALFNKVSNIVESVLNEFENDVEIFALLLEDFSRFVDVERRKADLIEQRTRDAEEGLGKTQRARAEVGKLLNDKAAGKQLPGVVVELLREGWSNYLFLLFVKEGVASEAWGKAVQVVDDLIWSVANDASFGHRSELLKMIPVLLQRLREGLNTISFSNKRMQELFSDLEVVHMDCLKQEPEKVADYTQQDTGDNQQKVLTEPSRKALAEQHSLPVADTVEVMTVVPVTIAPMIVEMPQLEPLDLTGNDEQPGDEFTSMVDSMAVGAWVEFINEQQEKSRCKLAAIIRVSGKYIFVNRVGIKIAEYTRSRLIDAAKKGVISMLDNALLFDRALESVIGHLREMKD